MEKIKETKKSYGIIIPKEIDMLLEPKDYLRLVENNKKIEERIALEKSALTELIEIVASSINCGLEMNSRAALFHLKDNELHPISLSEDSVRQVKIRTINYFKQKGYNICFFQGNDFAFGISVLDTDKDEED